VDGWGGFGLLLFFVVILLTVGLIHYYLWKRLVRDPLRPGWGRRGGTIVAVALCVLAPLTLVGVRAGYFTWLSWPGYLWIAVMFYLLVTLLVLEIPRLLLMRFWAGSGRTSAEARTATDDASAPIRIAKETAPASEPQPATAAGVNAARNSATSGIATGDSATNIGATAGTTTATAVPTVAGEKPLGTSGDGAAAPDSGPAAAENGPAAPDNGPAAATNGAVAPDNGPAAATNGAVAPDNGPAAATNGAVAPDNGPAAADNGLTSAGNEPDAEEKRGIERRLLLARGAAIFAGLTAAGITGYGVRTATSAPQIDRFQMLMAKLPRAMDGTRVAVVSDIHVGPLTGVDHAQRIVQVINSVNADLVCVVGDLVDGSVAELGRFAAPLAGIESRHGAFFVTGNHEYYSGVEEWVEEVARLGIRPLRNERVAINGLDLAGVNDLSGAQQGDAPDFARALGDRDTTRPVVLMAHQPVAAVEAAPFGVDLQVSGHTHGGQMAPFNMLVKLQQPVVSGFGEVDGVPVYVTNGAGFWGPPVRVGAPPQVTVIELRVA
jgi:predicted MPP superfamily phosphohydrolase